MSKKISCKNYDISINEVTYLQKLIEKINPTKVFILVDSNTEQYCLPHIYDRLPDTNLNVIRIKSGESYKTIATCNEIWQSLKDNHADRKSLMINLGGGVIGDMGGFCASTYMRGIPFVQVPTTLLSQVDASVGGKLGVDLDGVKNMIGVFQDPVAVVIDTNFLKTLPYKELLSGYAELLKHGLIADAKIWGELSVIKDITDIDFERIVHESVLIKKSVTEQDPHEKGIRKVLNFGHTIGHAIETLSLSTDQPLLHGEAIAIGIIMEAFLSYQNEFISQEEYLTIKTRIKALYGNKAKSLPSHEQIISIMKFDKKNNAGKILFALIKDIGQANFDITIDDAQIKAAVEDYKT
jgi:3-dehydroquinate synthase